MITVNFYFARDSFFDRAAVRNAMDKATNKAMFRAGALVRKIARNSLRFTKKAVSRPGQPPRVHTRDKVATLKNILFYYEPNTKTVVVGPVRLNMLTWNPVRPVAGAVPGLLEHGGVAAVREWQLDSGKWVRADNRMKRRLAWMASQGRLRLRRYQVDARPFMKPALDKASPELPKMFYNLLDKSKAG